MSWILNRNAGYPVHQVRQSCRIGFQFVLLGKASSVNEWKEEHEGELMDIDPVLISCGSRNLSIS